ncbi:uncharacterized protein LOC114321099 [Camellia sinensis]|uniref:uncharacterized protein LOC114321099 n=1 Tax=Camellia sinensis TaxID=4442 RepID=UPI0010359777|nr:uncharacterized protein LOC114321099 [Camellia sinensis]
MSGNGTASFGDSGSMPEVLHLGWGRWYTFRELETATNGLSVIDGGGHGIVYGGVLADSTRVAVKNLLNDRLSPQNTPLLPQPKGMVDAVVVPAPLSCYGCGCDRPKQFQLCLCLPSMIHPVQSSVATLIACDIVTGMLSTE